MPRRRRRRTKKQKARLQATFRLGAVLLLLVGVNIYVFFFRGGTSIDDVAKAAQAARLEAVKPKEAVPQPVEAEVEDPGWEKQGEIQKGDSLGRILQREGMTPPEADEIIRALRPVLDFRSLRPGQKYRVWFDAEGRVERFELRTSPVLLYRVERNGEGKLLAEEVKAETQTRVHEVTGIISSSLWDAVLTAGEGGELVALLADLFAYDINFFIETHEGDVFKILVEKEYLDNKFYKYGRVLGAEYTGRVGSFRAFWWDGTDGVKAGYYDEEGRSIQRSMLKTPLKFARVSSHFNPRRMHPILHRVKGHFGTDYAAPTGTPVWASATGRVTFAGWRGGAGNCVIIQHGGGLQTIYMHLSKFAKGIRPGKTVQQKEVIGYVGSTGLATGPHLHFSVKKNGRYLDPMKLKPERARPIPREHMAAFLEAIGPRVASLDRLAPATKTAAASTPESPL